MNQCEPQRLVWHLFDSLKSRHIESKNVVCIVVVYHKFVLFVSFVRQPFDIASWKVVNQCKVSQCYLRIFFFSSEFSIFCFNLYSKKRKKKMRTSFWNHRIIILVSWTRQLPLIKSWAKIIKFFSNSSMQLFSITWTHAHHTLFSSVGSSQS